MDRLAYTSLSAVISQSEIRAQLTNSLANVSTVGFKESYELASQTAKVEGDGLRPCINRCGSNAMFLGLIRAPSLPLAIKWMWR